MWLATNDLMCPPCCDLCEPPIERPTCLFLCLTLVERLYDLFSLLHFCRQLYMFRLLTPINKSSNSTTRADGNQEKPASRWPVAGLTEYWLLASNPATKDYSQIIYWSINKPINSKVFQYSSSGCYYWNFEHRCNQRMFTEGSIDNLFW